jgi:zinc transporter ZupT
MPILVLVLMFMLGTSHASEEESNSTLDIGKALLMSAIGFATFAMSILPWYVSGKAKENVANILQVGSAAAAGVILGSAFCHILPEAHELFLEYFEQADPEYEYKSYPFAELVCVAVFFVLFCIDKLLVDRIVHRKYELHVHVSKKKSEAESLALEQIHINLDPSERKDSHAGVSHNHFLSAIQSFTNDDSGVNERIEHLKRLSTAYIFLTALSIHSIFDGLGVGSELDADKFKNLLVAVVIHKLLDGFALGIPLYLAEIEKRNAWISLAFCAAMTPLGIGIGWAASAYMDSLANLLVRAIFLSFSMGSFIYIAFNELLPVSFESNNYLNVKLALLILSWGVMSLLALWA